VCAYLAQVGDYVTGPVHQRGAVAAVCAVQLRRQAGQRRDLARLAGLTALALGLQLALVRPPRLLLAHLLVCAPRVRHTLRQRPFLRHAPSADTSSRRRRSA
jgi:hypothetical protein